MMQTYDIAVPAGGAIQMALSGRYMRVINASSPVTVGFWQRGNLKGKAVNVNAGLWIRPDEAFDSITVESATAQTVSLMVGAGEAGYDQVTVSGTVNALDSKATTVADNAPVTVGIAATSILAANTARRCVRFLNTGTVPVYLGSAGVTTANGAIKLLPGSLWIETDAPGAAWYGISGTAGQVVNVQVLT